ncbi:SPW repeat domain-containing protein [Marinactinospora thermotolerans]|uniref:SPW repeat-containing protein n=1 Tax=Marinactinospora thermotolerans DSM 45154 TaxID=1122192 RepID=A0A1T4SBN1_9ACTN|nr:SPW repeat protein [Marinactinospora thermotolerans]SKA25654.1 SPW repeat-containing protein [Marinactinospora thermotolerans DSM 45154]
MRTKGRWEDWVSLVAGLAAAVSWLWHGMTGVGTAAMFVIGVLVVLASVMSITRPGVIATEGATLLLGALLFITPWGLGFTDVPAAAWTAWLAGAVIAVVGLVGLPLSTTAHHRAIPH